MLIMPNRDGRKMLNVYKSALVKSKSTELLNAKFNEIKDTSNGENMYMNLQFLQESVQQKEKYKSLPDINSIKSAEPRKKNRAPPIPPKQPPLKPPRKRLSKSTEVLSRIEIQTPHSGGNPKNLHSEKSEVSQNLDLLTIDTSTKPLDSNHFGVVQNLEKLTCCATCKNKTLTQTTTLSNATQRKSNTIALSSTTELRMLGLANCCFSEKLQPNRFFDSYSIINTFLSCSKHRSKDRKCATLPRSEKSSFGSVFHDEVEKKAITNQPLPSQYNQRIGKTPNFRLVDKPYML